MVQHRTAKVPDNIRPDIEMSQIPQEKIRWHHVASEAELAKALGAANHRVYEVPMLNETFLVSWDTLTIIRTGSLGGDTREVFGGWVYANLIVLMADEQEIVQLARNPMNKVF
jgi:hypothetical protein